MKKMMFTILLAVVSVSTVSAKMKIVTSSSDLKAIAKELCGEHGEVHSLTDGKRNLHYIEILPSYMLKVSKADIYLKVGLNLDYWADPIIDGSRNSSLQIVDCSEHIPRLQVPSDVDASMGDIHPEGNPHYWLNPKNGFTIADNICAALIQKDPGNTEGYKNNLNLFTEKLTAKIAEWKKAARNIAGAEVVSFHNSWPYLEEAFDIHVIGFIEPKPGIEPTASHTAEIIELIKKKQVKVILKEPYFSNRTPNSIAEATGAKLLTMATSVGGMDNTDDYFSLFDGIISVLTSAVKDN